MDQPLDLKVPADAAPEMVVATRPNEIALTGPGEGGFTTHVEKRIFLTDRTEYLVRVGEQLLKVQTPHRVAFSQGEACAVHLVDPMWYPADDAAAEKERARRQLV
jgi:iron(III) transport system ATP-binding protein